MEFFSWKIGPNTENFGPTIYQFSMNLGPTMDQFSMEYWSPDPFFHGILVLRDQYTVKVSMSRTKF